MPAETKGSPLSLAAWKTRARELKIEINVLCLAWQDERVPWFAKAFLILLLVYAFSPIDLIPDFIPVLGYLDDLLLLPIGVLLVVRLIPPGVLAEYREKARNGAAVYFPFGRFGTVLIIMLWLLVLFGAFRWLRRLLVR